MPLRGTAGISLVLGAAALALTAGPAGAAASRGYTTSPSPYHADARFVATYTGSGKYHTDFRATPPNDGGPPDRNFVHDSSTQGWALKFARGLGVPACGGEPDPCAAVTGLDGARGRARVTSRIRHRHIDGLYKNQNQTVSCDISAATGSRRLVPASVRVRYLPAEQSFAVSTTNPVASPLEKLLPHCPNEGDPIERILDNYATPGWSFDLAYDANRWFTSRAVKIPARAFHRSASITIPLAVTRRGRPPRNCSVEHPSYEKCSTGGSWSGTLVLRAR
jgi:hypothetical protein